MYLTTIYIDQSACHLREVVTLDNLVGHYLITLHMVTSLLTEAIKDYGSLLLSSLYPQEEVEKPRKIASNSLMS